MRDIERQLDSMQLRKPSADLDRRIAAARPDMTGREPVWNRPIPLWAAMVSCLLIAMVAYMSGARPEGFFPGNTVMSEHQADQALPPDTVFVSQDAKYLELFDFRGDGPEDPPC